MSEKHIISAELEIEVRDREGRLLEYRKQESKSFVKQFIDALYGIMKASTVHDDIIEIKKTDGVMGHFPILTSTTDPLFKAEAGAGDDRYGILVGNSDEAVAYDDYNLKGKISNGTGAGQLSYGATTIETPYKEGTEYKFRITRGFVNNSGASITVKEVGLACCWYAESEDFLAIRDVLATPTSIPDGASLAVRYYIKVSVP